jgi:hypothetical protein
MCKLHCIDAHYRNVKVVCTHQLSCVLTVWCILRKQLFSSSYILQISHGVQFWRWCVVLQHTWSNVIPIRKSSLVLVTETECMHANSWSNGVHRLLRVCVHWYTTNTGDYLSFSLQRHSYSTRNFHVSITNCCTLPVNVINKDLSELTFVPLPSVNNQPVIVPENRWKICCPANQCVMYWVHS